MPDPNERRKIFESLADPAETPAPAAPKPRTFDKPSIGGEWGAPRPYGGHTGLDQPWKKGEGVGAARAGRVRFAGERSGYGNRVEVEHDDGDVTTYSHLDSIDVRNGDDIDEGSLLGRVGNTGDSHGAHLHYEVLRGGKKINPRETDIVPFRGATEVRRRAVGSPDRKAVFESLSDDRKSVFESLADQPTQIETSPATTSQPARSGDSPITPKPTSNASPAQAAPPGQPPGSRPTNSPELWAQSPASDFEREGDELIEQGMRDVAAGTTPPRRTHRPLDSNLPADLPERLPGLDPLHDRVSPGEGPGTYRVVDERVEAAHQRHERQAAVLRRRIERARREHDALKAQAQALDNARREEQTGAQLSRGGLRERDNALIQEQAETGFGRLHTIEEQELRKKIRSKGELIALDERRLHEAEAAANRAQGGHLGTIRAEDERRARAEPEEVAKDRAYLDSVPVAARTPQMPGQPDLNDPAQLRASRVANEEAAAPPPSADELARRERVSRTGWGEYFAQMPKSAVISLEGLGASTLKQIGVLSTGPLGALVPGAALVEGLRGNDVGSESLYYRAGQKIDDWTRYAVGSNPDLEQDLKVGKLPAAFGSMAGFVLGGWAMQAPKTAAFVLGGLSGGSQVYEEVKQLGGSESEAQIAALIGMGVLGPLEMAGGAPQVVERLNQGAQGAAWRALLREALKDAGKESVEEGLQEGASEFATGLISGKRRSLYEVLEAAGIGAVSGGLMSGAGSGVNALRGATTENVPAASAQAVDNAPAAGADGVKEEYQALAERLYGAGGLYEQAQQGHHLEEFRAAEEQFSRLSGRVINAPPRPSATGDTGVTNSVPAASGQGGAANSPAPVPGDTSPIVAQILRDNRDESPGTSERAVMEEMETRRRHGGTSTMAAPATPATQLEDLKAGRCAVVQVPAGERSVVPHGMRSFKDFDGGRIIYNPQQVSREDVVAAMDAGTLEKLNEHGTEGEIVGGGTLPPRGAAVAGGEEPDARRVDAARPVEVGQPAQALPGADVPAGAPGADGGLEGSLTGAHEEEVRRAVETADASAEPTFRRFPEGMGDSRVPRAAMPQIKSEHRGAMVQFLKGRGISHRQTEVRADSLKPSQADWSPEKVKKAMGFEGPDRSLLISSDGHVADGHHQWLSKVAADPAQMIPVIELDAPIDRLLLEMARFPSSGVDDASAAAAKGEGQSSPMKANGNDDASSAWAICSENYDYDTLNRPFAEKGHEIVVVGDPHAGRQLEVQAWDKGARRFEGEQVEGDKIGEAARRLYDRMGLGRAEAVTEVSRFPYYRPETVARSGRVYVARSSDGSVDFDRSGELYPAGKGVYYVGGEDAIKAKYAADFKGGKVEAASHEEFEKISSPSEPDTPKRDTPAKPKQGERLTVVPETAAEKADLAKSLRAKLEGGSDEQPTAAEAKAKASVKKEKIDPRTGLTDTQEEWLGGKLEDYAERHFINTDSYPRGSEEASPVELLEGLSKVNNGATLYARAGEPETFDVPGDGSFTVNNVEAANRLHQKITGQPIEGLPKEQNATVKVGTPKPRASKGGAPFKAYVAAMGGEVPTLKALKGLHRQLQADPEAAEQLGVNVFEVRSQIEGLRSKLDKNRNGLPVRRAYLAEVNEKIAGAESFPDLKAKVDAWVRKRAGRGKERQAEADADIAKFTPEDYLVYNPGSPYGDRATQQAQRDIRAAQRQVAGEAGVPVGYGDDTDIRWLDYERRQIGDDAADLLYEPKAAPGGDAGGSAVTASFIPANDTEYEEVKRRVTRQLKSLISGNTLAGGLYPAHVVAELMPDLARLGAYHIRNGARSLAEFSARMVEDLGEGIRPHLEMIYAEARKLVEGEHERENPTDAAAHSGLASDDTGEAVPVVGQSGTERQSQGETDTADNARDEESRVVAGTAGNDDTGRGAGAVRDDRKERSFPQTLEAAGLEGGDDRTYEVYSNRQALEEADEIIRDKGLDGAAEYLRNADDWGAEHTALAYRLLAQSDGQKAVDIAATAARALTRSGQAVQAAQLVSCLAPERVAVVATQIARSAGTELTPEHLANIRKLAARTLEEEERADALAAKLAGAQATIRRLRDERPPKKRETPGVKARKMTNRLISRLEKLEAEARARMSARKALMEAAPTSGERGASIIPADLADLALIGAARMAKGALKRSVWCNDMLAEFGEAVRDSLPLIRQQAARHYREEKRKLRREALAHSVTGGKPEEFTDAEIDELIEARRLRLRERARAEKEVAREAGERPAARAKAEPKQGPRLSEGVGRKEGPRLTEAPAQGPRLSEGLKAGPPAPDALAREVMALTAGADEMVRAGALLIATRGDVTPEQYFAEMKSRFGVNERRIGGSFREAYEAVKQARRNLADRAAENAVTGGNPAALPREEVCRLVEERRAAQEAAAEARRDLAKAFEALDPPEPLDRALGILADVWNLPRSLKSTLDLSALGRQGYLGALSDFEAARAAAGASFAPLARSRRLSEEGFERVVEAVRADKHHRLGKKSGLYLATREHGRGDTIVSWRQIARREEAFASRLASRIPGVGASERAYVGTLDTLRMGMFSHLADEILSNKELNDGEQRKALEYAAKRVNHLTGRGTIGKTDSFGGAAVFINGVFFAPRFMISRFQALSPLQSARAPKGARLITGKKVGRVLALHGLAMAALALMGFKVGWDDPEDPDWMKARRGDHVYDLTAGLQQPARAILRTAARAVKAARGRQKAGDSTAFDVWGDFFERKLNPSASYVKGAITGKTLEYDDVTGKKKDFEYLGHVWDEKGRLNPGGGLVDLAAPLFFKDVWGSYQKHGAAGLAAAAPALFGIGYQDYPDRARAVVPDRVQAEYDRLGMAAPRPGRKLKVGGHDYELTADEYERYRKDVEADAFKRLGALFEPQDEAGRKRLAFYQKLDVEKQKDFLQGIHRDAAEAARGRVKRDLLQKVMRPADANRPPDAPPVTSNRRPGVAPVTEQEAAQAEEDEYVLADERRAAGRPEVTDAEAKRVAELLDRKMDDGLFAEFAQHLDEGVQMGVVGEGASAAAEYAARGLGAVGLTNASKNAELIRVSRVLMRERRLRPVQFARDALAGRYGERLRGEVEEGIYYPQNHFPEGGYGRGESSPKKAGAVITPEEATRAVERLGRNANRP
jgi:Peptidase family M23